MAGKSKREKKKRAKMRKQQADGLRQVGNKVVAKQLKEVEMPMETLEENVKRLGAAKGGKPFDPKSLVADILKKHGA